MPPNRADRTITGLERQKRRRGRLNIFLDGEFAFAVDLETCARFGLRRGDTLDASQISRILEAGDEHAARLSALRLLRTRLRSEQELQRRLERDAIPAAVAARVIRRLRESGIVDDRRFADAYVHDLTLRGTAGISILRRKLREKGLAPDVIDEALAPHRSQEGQNALATASAQRYLRTRGARSKADRLALRRGLVQYLGRRGFEWPVISAVVRALPQFRSLPPEEE